VRSGSFLRLASGRALNTPITATSYKHFVACQGENAWNAELAYPFGDLTKGSCMERMKPKTIHDGCVCRVRDGESWSLATPGGVRTRRGARRCWRLCMRSGSC